MWVHLLSATRPPPRRERQAFKEVPKSSTASRRQLPLELAQEPIEEGC
jgi:hypothetical protein